MSVKCKRLPVRSVSSSDDIQNGNMPQSPSKNVHLVAMKQKDVNNERHGPVIARLVEILCYLRGKQCKHFSYQKSSNPISTST